MRRLALALTLAASPAAAQDPARESPITVRDAYALAATPTATAGTAYMVLANAGEPDRLLSAASPAAQEVQIHSSVTDDQGVVRMEELTALDLPANGEAELARGGAHLMFLGLTDPWEDGDTVPVTLTFENAGDVTVEVPVDLDRLTDPDGAADHGATDHSGHGG